MKYHIFGSKCKKSNHITFKIAKFCAEFQANLVINQFQCRNIIVNRIFLFMQDRRKCHL